MVRRVSGGFGLVLALCLGLALAGFGALAAYGQSTAGQSAAGHSAAAGQTAAGAQLSGLARLGPEGVSIAAARGGLDLSIDLTQPVPWRVFTLDDPWRLVLDFSELDWTGAEARGLAACCDALREVALGTYRPGWSRMVLALDAPLALREAVMSTDDDGRARVRLRLEPTDPERFAAAAGAPETALFQTTDGPALARPAQPDRLPVVVLDPGHGGLDPGAEREGLREADIVLSFARELKEVLLRTGRFDVVLTREDDVFVPLEERVSIARRAGAAVFLSLHADALAEGRATGATVYTLSDDASDAASATLAERHDRADLLAGVDLSQTGDEIALVLMDLARTETRPRAERLADALVEGLHSATQSTHKTPRLQAAFSVLKAPDIPSALIEIGFMSSPRDLANMTDPDWRRAAAEGIRDGLLYWALEDQALAGRLRR